MVTLMGSVLPDSSTGVAARGDLRPWSDKVLDGALLDFLIENFFMKIGFASFKKS